MIDTEILSELIPKKEWEPFQEGREEEYIQPLIDLGYLPVGAEKKTKLLQKAISQFRREYRVLNWLQSGLDIPNHIDLELEREPDSLEIKLLHLLIDMDGDFKIEQLPLEGEQSIISRVIFYRLTVMGCLLYTSPSPRD